MKITDEKLFDLLVTALEGGINYWADRPQVPNGSIDPDHVFQYLNNGGSVEVYEFEDGECVGSLTKEAMINGVEILKEKYPHHYEDIEADNEDAETADAWFQISCMGDIVYS